MIDRIVRRAAAMMARQPQQRAVSDYYPSLQSRSPITRSLAGVHEHDLSSYVGYAQTYGCYVWVRKAIDRIADALSALPVLVLDREGQKLPHHPVAQLLLAVNPTIDGVRLWRIWVLHMLLGGEAYIEVAETQRGVPAELWPRSPEHLAVVPDDAFPLYPRVGGYLYRDEGLDVTIPPKRMIVSMYHNPINQWRGLAPIAAVRNGIIIDMYAQAWGKTFLQHGARPDYAIESEVALTAAERERLLSEIVATYSTTDGWHRPVILDDGVKINPFSWAPKDIEWLEQRRVSRDEVAALFGVPDEIMGFGKDTYENFDQAHRVFWALTIRPLAQLRDRSLNHFFTARGMLRNGEYIATDYAGVGALKEDVSSRFEQALTLWGMGVPFNQLDEQLGLGIGPIEGGDIGYVSAAVLPVGQAGEREEQAPERPEQRGSRVLLPSKAHPGKYCALLSVDAKTTSHRRRDAIERRLEAATREYLEGQYRIAADAVTASPSASAAVPSKQLAAVDAVLLLLDHGDVVEQLMLPFYRQLLRLAFRDAESVLDLSLSFSLQNPDVQRVLGELAQLVRRVSNTTREDIRQLIGRQAMEGWGIDRLAIELLNAGVTQSKRRARMIAVNESARAYSAGSYLGYTESGLVEAVEWVATIDERTTDICRALDGQTRPLGTPFVYGGTSVLHPPGHPGICRSAIAPVIARKDDSSGQDDLPD